MKIYKLISLTILIFSFSFQYSLSKEIIISLKNETALTRDDEPIVIDKKKFSEMVGSVPDNSVPIIKKDKKDVPCQLDDLNGDGFWDELAFSYSFKPMEEAKFEIVFVQPFEVPKYPVRTNIRMAKFNKSTFEFEELKAETRPKEHVIQNSPIMYQMEGPAWENDKIGFRIYFDSRNSKDLFGKKVDNMVMDRVGINENYQKMQSWVMDILKVDESLGAGSLAVMEEGTIYPIKDTDVARFELVAEGPVRSIFRIIYEGWKVGNNSYNITEQVTIWAGKYWYKSDVTVSNFMGEKTLLVGVPNFKTDEIIRSKPNTGYFTLATHGKQSENNDNLGLGLITRFEDFLGAEEAPESGPGIVQSYYARLKASNKVPVTFYFMAGWEVSDSKFADRNFFIEQLHKEAEKINVPITLAKSK